MNRTGSICLYFTVVALILGGCTAPQTPDSVDAPGEVHPTSQPVFTTTSIRQAVPTTVATTLPVITDPLDHKPEISQEQAISTTTSVRDDLPTETTLGLGETVTFDSETRPEITYTSKLPPAGFRGVLYANTDYPTIEFQFLDAETNAVSNTEVTGSYALDCWTYFSADGNEWNLLYDEYDPASAGSIPRYLIRGHWGEAPIAVPISFQEYVKFLKQTFQSRSQFDSGQLSFVLTNYDNGFSLNVNGVVREYHVQHWNYSNYLHRDEEAVPSKSEPDTGLVSSAFETPGGEPRGGFGASLHGTDGELFAR